MRLALLLPGLLSVAGLLSGPAAADDLSRYDKPLAGERRCATVTDKALQRVNYIFRNAAGRTSRIVELDTDPKFLKLVAINTFSYNAAGHLIKQVSDDGDGKPVIYTHRYDAGRLVEVRYDKDGDGKPDESTTYTYDGKDLPKPPINRDQPTLEVEATLRSLAALPTALAFTGTVTEHVNLWFDRRSPGDWTTEYTYDATGRRSKAVLHLSGSRDRTTSFRRDPDGNLLGTIETPPDERMGDDVFNWKAGRLISIVSGQPERYRKVFTYDTKGRVTRQRNTQDRTLEVIDRTIVYECD